MHVDAADTLSDAVIVPLAERPDLDDLRGCESSARP